jgi:phosphoribosyl 1,2-cyclic phosphodiesterase
MKEVFEVTFWGVRGSYPVPGKSTLFFGGNTTCVEVTIGQTTIILDAGTGIINLGNKLAAEYFSKGRERPLELTLLFTHLHHDHTQGFPFFTPLYIGKSILHLYGPKNFDGELTMALERSMMPPNFPVDFHHPNSVKNLTTIKENNLILLKANANTPTLLNKFFDKYEHRESGILITLMSDYSHPANGVFVYRIEYCGKAVVFCTDVEGYLFGNSKLVQFAQGADLLIHDAQYSKEEYTALPVPKQGFGHSIPEMAIEIAKKADVKNVALTHHDPSASDTKLKRYQTQYKRKFQNLFYAREGFTFQV